MTPPTFKYLSGFFGNLADKQQKKLSEESGVEILLAPNWLDLLRSSYEDHTKNAIKGYTKSGSSTRLDRHKVAAALVMATIQADPLNVRSIDGFMSHRCREATAFLAVQIGCIVILLFGITEANDTENEDLAKVYKDKDFGKFLDLPTGNGDGDYQSQLVKAINFARNGSNPVPDGYALLLSHIFFLLQSFYERERCKLLNIDPNGDSMNLRERMLRIEQLDPESH